jgi:N-acetylglucosamine malate deacetylase 1
LSERISRQLLKVASLRLFDIGQRFNIFIAPVHYHVPLASARVLRRDRDHWNLLNSGIRHLFRLARHPRALLDSVLTYPRFLGTIKPRLMSQDSAQIAGVQSSILASYWPVRMECRIGARILAVSPHADDETIGAGGLLITHKDVSQIAVITVFNGEGGGSLASADCAGKEYKARLIAKRRDELVSACKHFHGQIIGALDIPDGTEPTEFRSAAVRFRELVQSFKPDVVILPNFLDKQQDHQTTNRLWASACRDLRCIILGSEIWSLHVAPNAYFDISDALAGKLLAIGEFDSQLASVDYQRLVEGLAKVRGFQCPGIVRRSGAAEAFFAMPNADYCDLVSNFFGDEYQRVAA